MSVRRLAEASVQPTAFAFKGAMRGEVKKWIGKYPKGREQSAVIPLLMLAQEQEGWVSKAAIENVAQMLAMPAIRVLEVATFYTQFQLKPVGTRAHVQVCGTTPCMLRGSEELMAICRDKIHPEPLHTNASGTLSWEEVECQGACVNAPMVMIFKDAYEDLTPQRLAEIIDQFEAGKGASVKTGPQIDRIFSAPAGGLTTLTGKYGSADSATKAGSAPKNAKNSKDGKSETAINAGKPKAITEIAVPAVKSPVNPLKASVAVAKATATEAKAAKTTEGKPAATMSTKLAGEQASAPISTLVSLADKNRPAAIEKPATPDDLKLISGVGPKLEGVLHGLGIFTYAQVASWKKAERDWVDGYLKFKGRIERDDWVKQAKALAKGGEAEYIRVFGKKPR